MTNAEYCFDAWAIRQIAANDFGRDHWDNDDQINYMDNTVNPGTDDYDIGEIIEDEDDIDSFINNDGDFWGDSNSQRKDPTDDDYNQTYTYDYNGLFSRSKVISNLHRHFRCRSEGR